MAPDNTTQLPHPLGSPFHRKRAPCTGLFDPVFLPLGCARFLPPRSSVNRLTRLDHKSELLRPPINSVIIRELKSIGDEWLTTVHSPEKPCRAGDQLTDQEFHLETTNRDTIPGIAYHGREQVLGAVDNPVVSKSGL